jgi:hypothetical protein
MLFWLSERGLNLFVTSAHGATCKIPLHHTGVLPTLGENLSICWVSIEVGTWSVSVEEECGELSHRFWRSHLRGAFWPCWLIVYYIRANCATYTSIVAYRIERFYPLQIYYEGCINSCSKFGLSNPQIADHKSMCCVNTSIMPRKWQPIALQIWHI